MIARALWGYYKGSGYYKSVCAYVCKMPRREPLTHSPLLASWRSDLGVVRFVRSVAVPATYRRRSTGPFIHIHAGPTCSRQSRANLAKDS